MYTTNNQNRDAVTTMKVKEGRLFLAERTNRIFHNKASQLTLRIQSFLSYYELRFMRG